MFPFKIILGMSAKSIMFPLTWVILDVFTTRMVVILLALRRMSQCVQAEKWGVFFRGLGVKASLDKTAFCRDIISPSRAAVSSSRMRPILLAVLTSAAPHPTPSPSIPLSPCHFHPWDFPRLHPFCSFPSAPACSLFPSLQLSPHPCPWFLCRSRAFVSILESCLAGAGPSASGPCLSSVTLGSPAPALAVCTFPALRWCSLPCKMCQEHSV